MRRRFIFRAARITAGCVPRELWIGVEIDADLPVDLRRISELTGFDLIPADRLTTEELASVGVVDFEPITLHTP